MILDDLRPIEDELVALRRDLHEHPELAFEEHRTSGLVAQLLAGWGWKVRRGMGTTGVKGSLSVVHGTRAIALRADFDALPIQENAGSAWISRYPGKMHACGHDGHTAMLLGAARYLGSTRRFSGTVHVIFQPAEEVGAGAPRMIADGLFEQFSCEAVFGMHNIPGMEFGVLGFREGPFWAAVDQVDVELKGFGGHGSKPHLARDPIVAGAAIVMAAQTIVSRNVDPLEVAVVSVGVFSGGTAHNVIADSARCSFSTRSFSKKTRELLLDRLRNLIAAQAESFGVGVQIEHNHGCPVLENDPAFTRLARDVALQHHGAKRVAIHADQMPFSDDFAFMLQCRPGSYIVIGWGESRPLHHPAYDFNDRLLLVGATYWINLVENYLMNG